MGAGASRTYAGEIAVENGKLLQPKCLGVQIDSPGSMIIASASSIQVHPTSAAVFGGLDVTIRGSSSSKLSIALDSSTNHVPNTMGRATAKSWTLEELLRERQSASLDAVGNRVVIERAPTDRVRINIDRPHMVFEPGEALSMDISGYRTGMPQRNYRMQVQFIDMMKGEVVFQENHSINIDALGDFPLFSPSTLTMPDKGGVYEVRVQVYPRRFLSNLVQPAPLMERRLQMVVVDRQSIPADTTPWQIVDRIDPIPSSKPMSFASLPRIPDVPWLSPGKRSLSSGPTSTRQVGELEMLQIGTEQWHAFSLSSLEIGKPHLLTVRVPQDEPMALAISILDRNGAGEMVPISLDSGMLVERPEYHSELGMAEHEIVFWPKTESPILLLFNPHQQLGATVAGIEIRAGPRSLPRFTKTSLEPLPASPGLSSVSHSVPQVSTALQVNAVPKEARPRGRLVAIQLDKPLLPEAFGGHDALDPDTGRVGDDWNAFYYSANRLAEYCHWAGYNGAMVSIQCESGGLYPSQILQQTTRFDSGVFFTDGRDPVTKDVVELLMRVFDREGLQLVVTLDLVGPIPELEQLRRSGAVTANSIEQLDVNGEVWPGRDGQAIQGYPRYNPLDSRFQSVLHQILEELTQRYSNHPSWKGVALRMSPTSHFLFGGDRWGLNESLIKGFETSLQGNLPADVAKRAQLLQGPLQGSWHRWRASQLALFYDSLGAQLKRANSNVELYLLTSSLFEEPPSTLGFSDPYLATRDPLLAIQAYGLDFESLAAKKNVTVLRGETVQPLESIVARRWSIETASDRRIDRAFASLTKSGGQILQPPRGFPLPSFDQRSPIGKDKTQVWIFPHVQNAGSQAKHQFLRRLSTDDCLTLTQGGWLPIFGQESVLRDLLTTFAQLPSSKLTFVPAGRENEGDSNVVVRIGQEDGQAYLVLLNDAPWPELIRLNWSHSSSIPTQWLSDQPQNIDSMIYNIQSQTWSIPIQGYQLLACRISPLESRIESWSHQPDEQVKRKLETRLNLQADRVNRIVTQQSSFDGLANGGFEISASKASEPAGWLLSLLPSATIELDTKNPHSGNACLRIDNRSDGNASVWIESAPLTIPSTGRLAVQIFVRYVPGGPQPRLRLSLKGRMTDGKRFTRHSDLSPVSNLPNRTSDPLAAYNANSWTEYVRPLMQDFAPEDLAQLQLAIDVEGAGTVWIDDIRVYDLFLLDEERRDLRSNVFLAKRELQEYGNLTIGQRFLESYWIEYLRRFVPMERTNTAQLQSPILPQTAGIQASKGDEESNKGSPASPPPPTAEENRGWLQRFRDGVRRPWMR